MEWLEWIYRTVWMDSDMLLTIVAVIFTLMSIFTVAGLVIMQFTNGLFILIPFAVPVIGLLIILMMSILTLVCHFIFAETGEITAMFFAYLTGGFLAFFIFVSLYVVGLDLDMVSEIL